MDPINIEEVISPLQQRTLRSAGLVIVRAADLVGGEGDELGRDERISKLLKSGLAGPLCNISDIMAAACHVGKVRERHIIGSTRHRAVAWVRQAVMYLARDLTDLSYPQIARHLGGRDHSTIVHGEKAVRERLEREEPETVALIPAIRRRVRTELRHRLERLHV